MWSFLASLWIRQHQIGLVQGTQIYRKFETMWTFFRGLLQFCTCKSSKKPTFFTLRHQRLYCKVIPDGRLHHYHSCRHISHTDHLPKLLLRQHYILLDHLLYHKRLLQAILPSWWAGHGRLCKSWEPNTGISTQSTLDILYRFFQIRLVLCQVESGIILQMIVPSTD